MDLSSIFIYGLAIIHLHIQSLRSNFGVKLCYLTNILSIFRFCHLPQSYPLWQSFPSPPGPQVQNAMEDRALHLVVMPLQFLLI